MSNEQPLYLVMVEPDNNNNKYYRMIPNGYSFEVQYGRVGNDNYQSMTYDMSLWHTKLNEKLKKGYVDQTRLIARPLTKKQDKTYADVKNPSVANIISKLQSMARQAIQENYTISSKAVTQTMIDEAQALIGKLSRARDVQTFNEYLVTLFRTIPRKMGNVRDYLASSDQSILKILQSEQDLLDVMRGQVVQQSIIGDDVNDTSSEVKQTILDVLGLEISGVENSDVATIKKNLQEMHYRYNDAWTVVNKKTASVFSNFIQQSNITNRMLLWHGSRNENWWSF